MSVIRDSARFPEDFMFQLDEFADLKSQIVTSSWGGMPRARPYAFTEQGVAMLSSVLRSTHARRPRAHFHMHAVPARSRWIPAFAGMT